MIQTVNQFRKELIGALEVLTELKEATPQFLVYQSIYSQLKWLEEASRETDPRQLGEKARLNFGLLAVRELENSSVPTARALAFRLYELSYFVDQDSP